MRKICIHLNHVVIAPRQSILEAIQVGGAKPLLASALQHLHSGGLLCESLDQLSSAVWRAIVDDQNIQRLFYFEDGGDQGSEILSFVVGRDDDYRVHRAPCLTNLSSGGISRLLTRL